MDEVDDVGLEFFEVGFEAAFEEIVAVFHFDDVGLVAHGDVGVEEALDAEVLVGVGIEAFFFGECFLGGVAGEDVDVMSAALEFFGDAEGDDFGAGDVMGEELVDGEENSHIGTGLEPQMNTDEWDVSPPPTFIHQEEQERHDDDGLNHGDTETRRTTTGGAEDAKGVWFFGV
jgi:hypothetical protein